MKDLYLHCNLLKGQSNYSVLFAWCWVITGNLMYIKWIGVSSNVEKWAVPEFTF